MADIALVMGDFGGDIELQGMDLLADDGLETAVIISLFTDRRASSDQLPPEQAGEDLRGYWGDVVPAVEGDHTGSLLWLLQREKQTSQTRSRAEQYCRDALRWMIDDRVSNRIEVSASYVTRGVMRIVIDIYRPDQSPAQYRYDFEWTAQAVKRAA